MKGLKGELARSEGGVAGDLGSHQVLSNMEGGVFLGQSVADPRQPI